VIVIDKMRKLDVLAVAAITYVFLFLVLPRNVPLNDDPIFYMSVKNYVERGALEIHKYVTPTFILQYLYSILLVKIFGFSHEVLMVGTMLVAGIAVIATYLFLKEFFSEKMAFIGAAILLTNPIFYNLSHSFMTDVPALAFTMLTVLAAFKLVSGKDDKYLIVVSVFGVLSFLVKQTAIIPLAGVALYLLLEKRLNLKNLAVLGLLPLIVVTGWFYWYYEIYGPSPKITEKTAYLSEHLINVPYVLFKIFTYVGFFFFPVALVYMLNWRRVMRDFMGLGRAKTVPVFITLLAVLVPVYKFVANKRFIMPFAANIIEPEWLGPAYVAGVKPELFPDFWWVPITVLSFAALFCIALYAMKLPKDKKHLLLLCMIVPYAVLGFQIYHFDRYYIPLIPLVAPIVIYSVKDMRFGMEGLILMLVVFGVWSLYGTYDYLSWNTARWDAINYLLQQNVPIDEIDGGLEYNMLHFSDISFGCAVNRTYLISMNSDSFNGEVTYKTSCREKVYGNYSAIKSFGYEDILGRNAGTIYILKSQD